VADALRKMDGELRDGWPALSLLQKAGLASPALSPAAWKKAIAADWDESLHPRDDNGRFADKAGGHPENGAETQTGIGESPSSQHLGKINVHDMFYHALGVRS